MRRSTLIALVFGTGAVLTGRAVLAQSEDELAARAQLLHQAQGARAQGDHAHALDYASRALQIMATASVLRFIAEEERTLGRFAEALGNANRCIQHAAGEPQDANVARVVAGCRSLQTALDAQVGYLTLQVPSPLPAGFHAQVNGAELNSALYGVDTAVTPGTVSVVASAQGYPSFSRQVSVTAGQHASMVVQLQAEPSHAAETHPAPVAGRPVATQPVAMQPVASSRPMEAPPPAAHSNPLRAVGIAGIVVGAAGLLLGVFGQSYWQTNVGVFNSRTATHECTDQNGVITGLNAMGASVCGGEASDASLGQTIMYAGYAAGGAIAVLGVILFAVSATGSRERSTQTAWTCGPMGRDLGVSCAGVF